MGKQLPYTRNSISTEEIFSAWYFLSYEAQSCKPFQLHLSDLLTGSAWRGMNLALGLGGQEDTLKELILRHLSRLVWIHILLDVLLGTRTPNRTALRCPRLWVKMTTDWKANYALSHSRSFVGNNYTSMDARIGKCLFICLRQKRCIELDQF